MTTRIPKSTIIKTEQISQPSKSVLPINNDPVNISDPLLEKVTQFNLQVTKDWESNQIDSATFNTLYDVSAITSDIVSSDDPALLEKIDITKKLKIPKTQSIYTTTINDQKNVKIFEITNYSAKAAGNIGDVQFNLLNKFSARSKLNWNQSTKELVANGNVNVSNAIFTSEIAHPNANINITINGNNQYTFSSDGKFVSPKYTLPYLDGLLGQSLVADDTGNVEWNEVTVPYSRVHTITGATGTVTHNLETAHTFNHTNILSNFTINVTGTTLLTNNRTITLTLILNQNDPAYVPTGFQINGVSQSVLWSDNQPPTGFVGRKDVITYNIFNISSVYKVYGHYLPYFPAF